MGARAEFNSLLLQVVDGPAFRSGLKRSLYQKYKRSVHHVPPHIPQPSVVRASVTAKA